MRVHAGRSATLVRAARSRLAPGQPPPCDGGRATTELPSGETPPSRVISLVFRTLRLSFADLGVPARPRRRPQGARHHHAHPDPGRHAARLARRPRRARPRPHRLRQDLRVPAARSSPGSPSPAGRAVRGKPRALILAPTRELVGQIERGADPARRDRGADHPHRLRRRRPEPAGAGAAPRRRHRGRLPRPARGPDPAGPLRPRRRRGHRARRGRPHGRPRLPARRTPAARRDPEAGPAAALLRDARQGRQRPGQAVPPPAGDPRGRLGAVAGQRRWTTTCCTCRASSGCRCSST